jgi:hypothetical protein
MSIDTSLLEPGSDQLPLPIVCVALGDFYGMADLYISRMLGMLERHCPVPFRMVCYSDAARRVPAAIEMRDCSHWLGLRREGMRPTTMKLGLFNPEWVEFPEFLYLDLSLVIRRDLQQLLDYAFHRPEDLVIVRDWGYDCYNSSVMRIRRGTFSFVYQAFVAGETFPCYLPGDQDFIHAVIRDRGAQTRVAEFPRPMIASYKKVLKAGRQNAARARHMLSEATIVKFHGAPKMHEAFGLYYRFWYVRRREWRQGILRGVPIMELSRQWLDPHSR